MSLYRITVVLEEPLEVSPEADLEGAQVVLRERLNAVERAAEELYRFSSGRSS